MDRTGGEAGRLINQSLDSETPLRSGESTRATRNCVDFRNAKNTWCRRRLTRSGNCRKDTVPIGSDQLSRPRCSAGRECHRKLIAE